MATTPWQVSGQYFETCSCDYLCPCIFTNMTAQPTQGVCNVALAFHIDDGRYGNVTLDGLNFVVVAHTPGPMAQGNWSVGVITDQRAQPDQQQALLAIASGQAGGPMAGLAPLIGTFLGTEARQIDFTSADMRASVMIPNVLDQEVVAVPSHANTTQPMYLDNVAHPANTRLALGQASHSHLHAFGLDWDDVSGQNNGHFAPFNWQG